MFAVVNHSLKDEVRNDQDDIKTNGKVHCKFVLNTMKQRKCDNSKEKERKKAVDR